ncbi:MAG TPA: hypothetical protein VHE35_26090 [Kofleriaceae bacterium]|nr:hypothetical protein [Kofleriaceae bacterium]
MPLTLAVRRLLLASVTACAGASAIAACGGDDGGATADAGVDAMLGDPDTLVGQFTVDLVAPVAATETEPASDGYTSVLGVVYDKPQPQAVIWDVMLTDGSCVLRIPRVPFCETPCGGSAVCVDDDTCEPYATKQDVGTVHADGLMTTGGATAFDLISIAGSYQAPGDVHLAYPAFAPGGQLQLAAAGSAFTPAFTLTGTGIAPLQVTSPDPALARNQPTTITWAPPAGGGASRVTLLLDISHHGGSKGKIECDAPDNGTLTLSAELMTRLLDLGAAGFPTVIVTRQATSSALVTSGRVDLLLTSKVERPVTVPGLRSCTDDTGCDPPQTCQPDLTCG